MPIDVDFGMVWQGYNPRILTGRLAPEQPEFYFGGSQVPLRGMEGSQLDRLSVPIPVRPRRDILRSVKKLPMIRK